MTNKIVVLGGDGIGPEIMQSALNILEVAAKNIWSYEIEEHLVGGAAIDEYHHPLPDSTQQACKEADAILLGAIGGPDYVDAPVTPEDGLLSLRQSLDLFANIRPIKINDTLKHLSPLKEEIVNQTDFIIVRELLGGAYFGEPRYYSEELAYDTIHYTKASIERVVRTAFELAQKRAKKLTSVDKANVLASSRLWRKIVTEMAEQYPEVEVEHLYVDAASMKLITQPSEFDVLVTENLFGDILSDEASVIPGSLGLSPSASHSEAGPSLYEPIHGSAPDIKGMDIANPMSMIRSVTLMLRESFQQEELADLIDQACETVMKQGILTSDLGGDASTSKFTEAVITVLNKED